MDALTRYLMVLEACGGEATKLTQRRRWDCEQKWRHVYAKRLHAATGKWKWHDFDWHVFSFQHTNAVNGAKASTAYLQLDAQVLVVIPEAYSLPGLPAFQLSAAKLPRFQGSGLDVIVWPEDLNWTMAFTHEEGQLGPYFSRREWIVEDAD